MKNEQTGWQMAGATPRTAPASGWMFAPAAETPAPTRPVRRAPKRSRRVPRLVPALAAVGVLTTLIGGVAVARFPHRASASVQSAYPLSIAVTAQSGDTLWSLAKRYGSEDRYILDQVDEIAQANNMSDNIALMPGQRVWIPAHNAEERTLITARRLTR